MCPLLHGHKKTLSSQMDKESPILSYRLGMIYRGLGEKDMAKVYLETALGGDDPLIEN